MRQKLLKTNDAAKYLGVSRSSLTNWIKQGAITGGVTPGGHYRFTTKELDAFAAKRGLVRPVVEDEDDPDRKIRLLVIDDDEAFREFIHDALEVFADYELKEAVDGMQGAMLIGAWQPDLVILDVRMPNMDGKELLKLVRANPETAEINVLISSAHLSPELKNELEELDVDAILEKPVHLAKLIAQIQKLVDLRLA